MRSTMFFRCRNSFCVCSGGACSGRLSRYVDSTVLRSSHHALYAAFTCGCFSNSLIIPSTMDFTGQGRYPYRSLPFLFRTSSDSRSSRDSKTGISAGASRIPATASFRRALNRSRSSSRLCDWRIYIASSSSRNICRARRERSCTTPSFVSAGFCTLSA